MLASGEDGTCAALAGIASPPKTSIGATARSAERRRDTLWLSTDLQPDLRV
jgi:hypothetical protein